MLNMENLFAYTEVQYQLVYHILVLGVGTMLAGLVYFMVTSRFVAPKYRVSSFLSAVVMVSAALILYNQQMSWAESFAWDGKAHVPMLEENFSNGFRYANWSIDVPCLLIQLLIVLNITGAKFRSTFVGFVVAGLLMIWTGYVGQFYETSNITQLLIWGAISTVFYVYINYLIGMRIFKNLADMPKTARRVMKSVFWLLMISWVLYPLAYLAPWYAPSADGMVARQIMFTTADITSKVIYGVLLGYAAQVRSAAEGYEPAVKSLISDGKLPESMRLSSSKTAVPSS